MMKTILAAIAVAFLLTGCSSAGLVTAAAKAKGLTVDAYLERAETIQTERAAIEAERAGLRAEMVRRYRRIMEDCKDVECAREAYTEADGFLDKAKPELLTLQAIEALRKLR